LRARTQLRKMRGSVWKYDAMTIQILIGCRLPWIRGVVLASLFLATGAAHAAGPMRPFQVGLWNGGAYTNEQTGVFSHCAAYVPYVSGVAMFAVVNRFFGWSLAFSHQQWTLTPKTQIPIELHFDGGPPFNVFGIVLSPIMVGVPMPDNSKLLNTFRGSWQMLARAQGQVFLFNLNGTSKVMVQLVNCVRTELTLEGGSPGRPPAPAAAPSQPAAPLQSPTTSQEAQLEEMQLATNFLLAARLPNAHVLPRSDTPIELSSFGAAWKADDALGGVKIFQPRADLTGLGIASDLIGADSKTCKGKFASARSSELVDSDVVFRAATSCAESDNERSAEYFIAPRPMGGFVAFMVLALTQAERQSTAGNEKLDVFKKAALSSVTTRH
jgi:hypothetical protein